MIKVIIFDIGNVLARFGWEEYLRECGYEEEISRRIANATVHNKLWRELDRSVVLDDSLVAEFVAQDIGVAKEIAKFMEDSYGFVQEYDYSVELIEKLKANGYKVYLLSNYGGTNYRYAKDNFRFINSADGSLISYEVGYVKPEPEIFDALIKKFNFDPREAVFLDDVKINTEAAAALGFHVIQFTELKSALVELQKLGVRLT